MTTLGDVLEVLFARSDERCALRATAREWRDAERSEQVADAAASQLVDVKTPRLVRLTALPVRVVAGIKFRGAGDQPAAPTDLSRLEIWRDESGRYRLERCWDTAAGAQQLVTLAKVEAPGWGLDATQQSRDARRGGSLRRGGRWPAPSIVDAERLFEPSRLREMVSALEIAPLGESTVAGRAVLTVTAKPRSAALLWPHWLPYGADEFDLSFDVDHGHLLRIEGRSAGIAFETLEVTSIDYDASISTESLAF